ncbi:MAG: Cytochrome bacterial [Proteobacteria bacterium]|nr:Cytochrome bacterial [Pseudomonadota bacterium]
MQKILVWDWPVRLGHWLMVGGFALAWLTSESETFRLVHAISGGVVVAVALFRIPWGFIGSRYARFDDFVRGPNAVIDYLRSLLRLQPAHQTGHNPAGGWAIMLLLLLAIATGVVGWAMYNELGGEWLEDLHEGLAVAMLTVVIVHVAGVVSGSLMHGENLIRAMATGQKQGSPEAAIPSARPLAALILIAWVAAASWWLAS